MQGLESIIYQDRLIAMVFRHDLVPEDGITFFTDQKNSFQVGMHNVKPGKTMIPHIHLVKEPLVIGDVQELLMIRSGKIKVTLYTKEAKIIDEIMLETGDSILLISEGHGVEILEDTIIFEVKQGPYPGHEYAKLYIKQESANSTESTT